MSIYEESDKKEPLEVELEGGKLYEALHNQLGTGLDYKDSIIFINNEINELTLSDLIIRMVLFQMFLRIYSYISFI